MRVLGIDPGLAIIGYAIVDTQNGKDTLVDYGTIQTPAHTELGSRLSEIRDDFGAILDKYQPDLCGMEKLFFTKNVTNGIQVAHARGILVEMCYREKIPLHELTPNEIKLAITGNGAADKPSMQKMIQLLLKMDHFPKQDDAADAIGVALASGHMNIFQIK